MKSKKSVVALFVEHGGSHPNLAIPMLAHSETAEALEIENYKKKVLSNSRGDWKSFFFDWRKETELWQTKTSQELEEAKERYQCLYTQYAKIQFQLKELYQDSLRKKSEEEAKENRRLKRQLAKNKFSVTELKGILSLVKGRKEQIVSRRLFALVLLYLTGLRVSNLLVLTVLNGLELLDSGKTSIELIKGGEKRHPFILSKKGRLFLLDYKSEFETLIVGKKGSDFLFSAP